MDIKTFKVCVGLGPRALVLMVLASIVLLTSATPLIYPDTAALGQRLYKRAPGMECPDFEPFRCPHGNGCISIQYLCDGAPDCPGGHDEKTTLCTAAKRPPVEETASFLNSLLASHGPNYLEKLFGVKARNALKKMGGVRNVAIALSQSQTIDEFGHTLSLEKNDVDHLRSVFMAVENGDIGLLKSLGIKDSELGDVKFFLEKLVNTGFLD
ncbi:prohormone-4 isoform X3 [Hyalella azteca]|uniref:Prohormone-4 isoform X3 n=1 Tax=Hyalella azteca TaxID=294128 RepID=A0A979FI80_HYAAZ|nr:prohormone-4 isoform X3 [Hyalella azteca]